jgi:hypothetical protein
MVLALFFDVDCLKIPDISDQISGCGFVRRICFLFDGAKKQIPHFVRNDKAEAPASEGGPYKIS